MPPGIPLRLPVFAALALAAAALTTATASASATGVTLGSPVVPARVLDGTLSAARTSDKPCHTGLRIGQPGVATRSVMVPGLGDVTARLHGSSGDWDLAVYDAAGRAIAAGASPGPDEIGSGPALKAGMLTVQACRRTGTGRSARVVIEHSPISTAVKPEKVQLVDVATPTRADKARVMALGLDPSEGGGAHSVGLVLHGAADAQRLREAGFTWKVLDGDMVASDFRDRVREARLAARGFRSAVPSGRTTYRTLADYEDEMKTLAKENPDLVKLIELPEKTFLGRSVLGIEITKDVKARDGKPVFMNLGVHHAREWPAGEHPMEWAYELVNGFKAGDQRATKIVEQSRNIVVPIVNVDGFNASRTAGVGADAGRDEEVDDTAYYVSGAATGGEYRRKNCRLGDAEAANCTSSAALAENGTDPNRNYGGLWGGPGADTNPATQTYRGPGPFSEAETRNIQWLISRTQTMTMITNHTTAGLVLRAPGLASLGDPVDEDRGYKALGDEMALHNGYFSQKGFELYDTTGTTEDWSYNTTGGFGFTFEIYCGDPNYKTGDCDDPAFHPLYTTMAKEWDGTSDQADHKNDPGRSEEAPYGMVKGFDGGGNREAYYIAAESTINEARHSVLQGRAEPGLTLRLAKEFKTATFPQEDGKPILFDDKLETLLDVTGDGGFRWHVNPSTRPIVAKERGARDGGQPAPAETQTGGPTGSPSDPNDDGVALPGGDDNPTDPVNYNEHPITVPSTGDNRSANVRVVWTTPGSDYDIHLYDDANGNGDVDPGEREIGTSANGPTSEEETGIPGSGGPLPAGKKYVLKVANFAATEPYEVQIRWNGPEPYQPAQVESYAFSCLASDGTVLRSSQITIDRGEKKDLGLVCTDLTFDRSGPGGVGSDVQIGRSGSFRFAVALDLRRLRRALRLGIRARARCSEACRATVALKVDKRTKRRLGLRSRIVARGGVRRLVGRRTFKVRFTRDARRKLPRARRARLRIVSTGRELVGGRKVVLRNKYLLVRRARR